MTPIGVIGGTGLYELVEGGRSSEVVTRYGPVAVRAGTVSGREVVFLARHGEQHSVPPHRVNYRANIAALRQLGCGSVIATNAVGSLDRDLPPGAFALPGDFLDFTRRRETTFFEGEDGTVHHVDVSHPYCARLGEVVVAAGKDCGHRVQTGAIYACTEGPRFETPAEIRMMGVAGATVVGMTGVPETPLAREAGLCYASICIVTNFAAGISPTSLTRSEVDELMERCAASLKRLIAAAIARETDDPNCACRQPMR